ncbi:MAG: hypothetical protein HUU21_13615 [Polyangiaceae bacterium]|nr:hypothetical protein [Polyangiaceae bacterium]
MKTSGRALRSTRRSTSLVVAALTVALAAVGACGTDADGVFGNAGTAGSGGGGSPTSSASTGGGGGSSSSGSGPVCGDLLCHEGETPANCIQDCPPVCGDGACNGGETSASCSQDCGACGDGQCDGGETIANCPQDCKPVCGDGECNGNETTQSCAMDCPPVCGDGACNGDETAQSCAMDCSCAHPVCETGAALTPDCDPCVQMVCAQDPFCCNDNWDGQCVGEADSICGAGCCGDGQCNGENCASCPQDCGGVCVCGDGKCEAEDCASCAQDCGACQPEPTCPHSVCFVGSALDPAMCFDPCAAEVCMADPACCDGSPPAWDGDCTLLAQMTCGADACITAVCAVDPTCCTDDWTQACVDLAKTECMTQCDCAHSICTEGEKLSATCNPCAQAVCEADPYCCDNGWDGACVGEVEKICGINCN